MNKPSIIDDYGNKYWFVNGAPHRDDGPASVMINGTECWYNHGKLHRVDGPAVTYKMGGALLYIKNKKVTPKEYQHRLHLSNEFMLMLRLKYIFI